MKPVAKSRTGSGNPKGVNKDWRKTSPTYFEVIPKSSTGSSGQLKGARREEMDPKKGMAPIDKSLPKVPTKPRKWTSCGYTLTGPVTQDFGKV